MKSSSQRSPSVSSTIKTKGLLKTLIYTIEINPSYKKNRLPSIRDKNGGARYWKYIQVSDDKKDLKTSGLKDVEAIGFPRHIRTMSYANHHITNIVHNLFCFGNSEDEDVTVALHVNSLLGKLILNEVRGIYDDDYLIVEVEIGRYTCRKIWMIKMSPCVSLVNNYLDCGVFVMRHMETYRGEDNSGDINCLIKDDKEQLRQTSDLRYKYAAKILLANYNMVKSKFE
ncbi:hypothetical protein Tco_0737253 [Tanacetum coccineum]